MFYASALPASMLWVTTHTVQGRGGQVLTIALVIAIVGLAGSVLFGGDGLTRLLSLRTRRQELGEAAVAQMRVNAALRQRIERLRDDPHHLESVARRHLGLVQPNEVVYRFAAPAGQPKPSPDSEPNAAAR